MWLSLEFKHSAFAYFSRLLAKNELSASWTPSPIPTQYREPKYSRCAVIVPHLVWPTTSLNPEMATMLQVEPLGKLARQRGLRLARTWRTNRTGSALSLGAMRFLCSTTGPWITSRGTWMYYMHELRRSACHLHNGAIGVLTYNVFWLAAVSCIAQRGTGRWYCTVQEHNESLNGIPGGMKVN